jgi:hypothetical protein
VSVPINLKILSVMLICVLLTSSCDKGKHVDQDETPSYIPKDPELYKSIVAMDTEFFEAYNLCDLEKQAAIYSEEIEFYHDRGGLSESKEDILNSTRDNICGKVTRTLVAESIEVYPINEYGAIQIGWHKFYNKEEPDAVSIPSKFIIFWKNENTKWRITKVVSLHN